MINRKPHKAYETPEWAHKRVPPPLKASADENCVSSKRQPRPARATACTTMLALENARACYCCGVGTSGGWDPRGTRARGKHGGILLTGASTWKGGGNRAEERRGRSRANGSRRRRQQQHQQQQEQQHHDQHHDHHDRARISVANTRVMTKKRSSQDGCNHRLGTHRHASVLLVGRLRMHVKQTSHGA